MGYPTGPYKFRVDVQHFGGHALKRYENADKRLFYQSLERDREREKSTQNTYLCTDFNNFKTYIY